MCRRPTILAILGPILLLSACRGTVTEYLLQASKGDPDSRTEAIVRLGELLREKEASRFPFSDAEKEAIEYLRDIARLDPEAMNRMRAITALRELRSVDSREVFLESLSSEYWGVRWEAAKALRDRPAEQDSERIAERLAVEPRPEVILDLVHCLAAIGDRTAIDALLKVYLDRTGRYTDNRLKAYEAIVRLSGRPWAYEEHEQWREYHERNYPEAKEPRTPRGLFEDLPGEDS